MKICILTQPLGTNYGGLLQAYALQTVLKNMGHDVLTEDRRYPKLSGKEALKYQIKRLLGPIRRRYYPAQNEVATIRKNTDKFIRERIRTTEPVYSNTKEELSKYNFDSYIVGSDQVWRPRYSPYLLNYFLDFAQDQNVKRIAYSASFGTSEWEFSEEETRQAAVLIKKFDAISVREDSGVRLCRDYFGVDALHTLDPTMLLDKQDYMSLINDDCVKKKETMKVVSYILDQSKEKWLVMDTISRRLEISFSDIERLGPKRDFISNGPRYISECIYPPVEDWLSRFSDADFVVTDSFHGTVFSLIFKIPFITIVNNRRGIDRFTSLLNYFKLENRLVSSHNKVQINELIETPIDFNSVEIIMRKAQSESLVFLNNALNNA